MVHQRSARKVVRQHSSCHHRCARCARCSLNPLESAFGRAVTDLATYAYWTDVVVAEVYRRRGIGRWLSETMLAHPQLQGLRRVSLLTRDAAPLYAQLGFRQGAGSLKYMEYRDERSGSEKPAA